MPKWRKVSDFPYSAEHLYSWHARNGAFVRLTPPWEKIKIVDTDGDGNDDADDDDDDEHGNHDAGRSDL